MHSTQQRSACHHEQGKRHIKEGTAGGCAWTFRTTVAPAIQLSPDTSQAGKTIQSITAGQKRKFHQYRNLIERQQRENMSKANCLPSWEPCLRRYCKISRLISIEIWPMPPEDTSGKAPRRDVAKGKTQMNRSPALTVDQLSSSSSSFTRSRSSLPGLKCGTNLPSRLTD